MALVQRMCDAHHWNRGELATQLMSMDDPAERLRARAGDADAFGALFDSYARAVYNHAFRQTGDWSVAEDVMAQTFLEAWRSRDRIASDGGSLRPWLLGIATNLARAHHRASGRQAEILSRLEPRQDSPDFSDEVAGRVDDANRIAALHRSLSLLQPDELDVIALCAWSELSYAETAEALGVPVGTVRSRLSRARTKLLKATEREIRRSPRGLAASVSHDADETTQAGPPFKEASQ